jgi:GAF domain-containing protein
VTDPWPSARSAPAGAGGPTQIAIEEFDTRLQAMLAVSRAVVSGGGLTETLDEIAEHACAIAHAASAAILLLTGDQRFRIVGKHGLSPDYVQMIDDWPTKLMPGRGPSGVAVAEGRPLLIEDFAADTRFADWKSIPLRRWQAMAVFPLIADGATLGTLVLYRTEAFVWAESETRVLGFVAEHAAAAVRTAQLLDEQQRHVAALERVVRGLRTQAHEHANRLHVIAGLLATDEPEEALAFVEDVTAANLLDRQSLLGGPHTVLTALLTVEAALAHHRSIALDTDSVAHLGGTALTDAQAVTIVGNLLDNAMQAVADMPMDRRRVALKIVRRETDVEISVRDWGPGIPEDVDPFTHGTTSKDGHAGVGLSLVAEAALAAYGEARLERLSTGLRVAVNVPYVSSGLPGDLGP